MAKVNLKVRLQKLLEKEFSTLSNDKNRVITGYQSLIDILQIPQLSTQLHGGHEVLFQCLSQIILTPFNQFFDDEQLHLLLELASNACVLSMSQNQIIDGWLQNLDDRAFEKPDNYDEDDDDDDLYEDATESDEEQEEEERTIKIRDMNKKPTPGGSTQHQAKHVFVDTPYGNKSNTVSAKEKNSSSTQSIPNPRNAHVAHSHNHRGGHQNFDRKEVTESVAVRGNNNRGARNNSITTNSNRGTDSGRGRGRRAPPFDNKYGVDLRLYDCYICGEYGHVQYDCPKKGGNSKSTSRGQARVGFNNNNNRKPNRSKSSSSTSSLETTPIKIDPNQVQQVYNQVSKLLNSSQTLDERNQTFDLFISLIEKLHHDHGDQLSNIFLEKESTFYPLFCHIAQNDFLFTNDQYRRFYDLKMILLPNKSNLLNKDRSSFCRQRHLSPLNILQEHIENTTVFQQTLFNDFQEYIIRSTSPISIVLYDLIKHLLQSNIYIDLQCLEYFTQQILFYIKKDLFSTEQLDELHICLDIRTKRWERNNQKQIWKERVNLFKTETFSVDLNQWMSEFKEILKAGSVEVKESSATAVDHAMWYFAVLLMASSGHLNKEQYEGLLQCAIQSSLFNRTQKFYFQFYLNQGRAPIMINELRELKIKLESDHVDQKKLAYEEIRKILERPKPEEVEQTSTKSQDPSIQNADIIIPIIDNHVLQRLISLVEMICSDTKTFSTEQCKDLLDQFLHHSTIIHPLSNVEQQRLKSYYSRPISLNELKILCSSIPSDLVDFLSLLKHRTLLNNDDIYDFLTEIIINIFENRRKFSNEKCEELKNLIEKKTFGRQRYHSINESYQKCRKTKANLPVINPLILNELLNKILTHEYQAHLDFFTLLEDVASTFDFDAKTIGSEIHRCLFSTIILVISEADFTNASNIDFFRQRLKTLIDKQPEFFSLLLTEQQHKLVLTRLSSTSNIDSFIDSLKHHWNETDFFNLIHFIQNDLKDKNDFEKLINLILYTFDNESLSIERTLQLSNSLIEHPVCHQKTFKYLLQFLIDLLQLHIHSSPKIYVDLIAKNQDNDQTMNEIRMMLKAENGKYAVADWKRTMVRLLTSLFDRTKDYGDLKDIAQHSPMLQMPVFKQQLQSYWNKSSENQVEASVTPKSDHSSVHREMFRHLESNNSSLNVLVEQQLHKYLLDQQLSTEISLTKFIQALQILFQNRRKFSKISLDEWATLIANNRGKIFSTDAQCDQLLINILFARLNMPIDTLNSIHSLIQSKKAHERHDGLQKLLAVLSNTDINSGQNLFEHLPTISNQLYQTITRVVFDQKFHDNQVRQCLTAARNSCLLNNDHRQKLKEI